MRRFFLATLLSVSIPIHVSASIIISALLPNPSGDDTLGEYIEVKNIGCVSVDIGGYSLIDASGKSYSIPSGISLSRHESRKFPYSETKISLNNSGIETITLRDANLTSIDTHSYSGTQKDNVVLSFGYIDESCTIIPPEIEPPPGDNLGSTISGEMGYPTESTGSTTGTGEIILPDPSSGTHSSGSVISGEVGVGDAQVSETATGKSLPETGSGETSQSGSSSTGVALSPEASSGVYAEPEIDPLMPLELYYDDADSDGKIDTLEIMYPYTLSGAVNTGAISLYSNTGGLYVDKINALTGYILEGSFSGNTLILKILESDGEKTMLKVNNTTSSELRLKSSGDLGFHSVGGKTAEQFFLTSSFESYQAVFRKPSNAIKSSSGSSEESSGTYANGALFLFPEILPTLQSPTNASFSGDVFTCTSPDCRINMTLDPIFSSGFSMKDYTCAFGTGEILIVDSDCNPNTFYYTSSRILIIELSEKANPLNHIRKTYTVEWKVVNSSKSLVPNAPVDVLVNQDMGKPVPVLELDVKWKDYYFQNGDHALICYAYTCSVNFTAENSYDPEGSAIRYLWIYGWNDISNSKDPGTRKYGMGEHSFILRVIDAAGNNDQIIYKIQVVGPKPKEEKKRIEKALKAKVKIEKILSSEIEKKKPKKIKMTLFSSPEIVLQGRTGEKIEVGKYRCLYKKKPICNMNFTLSGTLRGYEYAWTLDGEEIHKGKNPLAWKLTPGIHKVQISSFYKDETKPIVTEEFVIVVSAEPKKPLKPKKTKKASLPKNTKNPLTANIIPEASAYGSENPVATSSYGGIGFVSFIFGVALFSLFRRKKKL